MTSIPPVHCLTLNVAGPLASVHSLLPAGGSAHDFQLTSRERRQLESADLVILNGLGLETWLSRALELAGTRVVVEAAVGLHLQRNQDHGAPNPHVWLDPSLAAGMVTNILFALQRADPPNAAGYASNALAYVARLQALDAEIRSGLAGITNRAFVTAHDAFPYFARRYGLRIVGVLEELTDVDPSAAHLSALRRQIEANAVGVIFIDAHHVSRRARQLALDFKVRVGVLDTLEACPLAATAYEDGMRSNLRALQQNLR